MALQTAMVLEAAAALQSRPSAAFTLAKVIRVRPSVPQPVLRMPNAMPPRALSAVSRLGSA